MYIGLFVVFSINMGCSDDDEVDPLFEEDVATRIDQQLEVYRQLLVEPEFGWKVAYQPGEDQSIFNIHLQFTTGGDALVTSDYQEGNEDLVSTYRVGISQVPELVFENFTVFHKLFEADNFSTGAEFEFLFEEATSDRIIFKSKTDIGDRSQIIFEKATASDQQFIESLAIQDTRIASGLETSLQFKSIRSTQTDGSVFFEADFDFNIDSRIARSSFIENTTSYSETVHPLRITEDGFELLVPLQIGGQGVSNFAYDTTSDTHISNDGGFVTTIGTTAISVLSIADHLDSLHNQYSYFNDINFPVLTPLSVPFRDLSTAGGYSRMNLLFNVNLNGVGVVNIAQFEISEEGSVLVLFESVNVGNEKIVLSQEMQERIFLLGNATNADIPQLVGTLDVLFDPDGWLIERTGAFGSLETPIYTLRQIANSDNYFFSVLGLN